MNQGTKDRLKRLKLVVITQLSGEFISPPRVDFAWLEKFAHDEITMRVVQEVCGETLGTLNFKVPDGWFQMLKSKHAPHWFLKRWPVKYKTWTWEACALFPWVTLPEEKHHHVWIKRGEEYDEAE